MTYVEACNELCVARGVPVEVAEAAYRTLSKRAHPDVGGSTRRMAQLTAAVDTIRAAGFVTLPDPPTCRTANYTDGRLPWGKHRGELLSAVPLGYLAWVATECDDVRLRRDAVRVLHARAARLEEAA